jgi:hypothetical protein
LNNQAAELMRAMERKKYRTTITSSGSVDTWDKMSRMMCMTEAMDRIDRQTGFGHSASSTTGSQLPAEHVMRECLYYLRAFECFRVFAELDARGELAEAYFALHTSLILDEKAMALAFVKKGGGCGLRAYDGTVPRRGHAAQGALHHGHFSEPGRRIGVLVPTQPRDGCSVRPISRAFRLEARVRWAKMG